MKLQCYTFIERIIRSDFLKSTGIVRKVDELGRIVIPIELRRTLTIDVKDPLEIFTEGNTIILKKYHPACIFCGEVRDVQNFKEKLMCNKCIDDIKKSYQQ